MAHLFHFYLWNYLDGMVYAKWPNFPLTRVDITHPLPFKRWIFSFITFSFDRNLGSSRSRNWINFSSCSKLDFWSRGPPIIPEPIQRLYGFSDISLLPFPNYVWGIHAKSHFHVALQRSTQLLLFLRFPILPFSPSSPFHSLRWICIMREFHLLLCVREGETVLLINSSERKRLLIFFRIARPGSKE